MVQIEHFGTNNEIPRPAFNDRFNDASNASGPRLGKARDGKLSLRASSALISRLIRIDRLGSSGTGGSCNDRSGFNIKDSCMAAPGKLRSIPSAALIVASAALSV